MEYTNLLGLPANLAETLKSHDKKYLSTKSDEDFTVTELINPPWLVQLSKKHNKELIVDVSDRIWLMLGSIVHNILEAGETGDQLIEERFNDIIGGVKYSGMVDVYEGTKLSDWKFTSIYTLSNKERMAGYESQLNILAYLMGISGFVVDEIEFTGILRDWGLRHKNKYPTQIETVKLRLWGKEEQKEFIKGRIRAHTSKQVFPCTAGERWNNGDEYACMKKNRKTAIRVGMDRELIEKRVEFEKAKHPKENFYLEVRPAENKRCENYCSVKDFCEFYNNLQDINK